VNSSNFWLSNKANNSQELFHLQEKADTIIEEEEELFRDHMTYLKEDAQLLTEEGKLINDLQRNIPLSKIQ